LDGARAMLPFLDLVVDMRDLDGAHFDGGVANHLWSRADAGRPAEVEEPVFFRPVQIIGPNMGLTRDDDRVANPPSAGDHVRSLRRLKLAEFRFARFTLGVSGLFRVDGGLNAFDKLAGH